LSLSILSNVEACSSPQKDPHDRGQRLDTWYGKLLRIDVHKKQGKRNYSIPPSNPFVNRSDARPEIFAYGFRNPWGMSFDVKGRLFLADVGYNDREELNIVHKGGNYGWNIKEGTMISPWAKRPIPRNLIDPIYEYKKPAEMGAIIGGYPLLSDRNSVLYLGGDISGILFLLEEHPVTRRWRRISTRRLSKGIFIKSFGRGGDGSIYVLTSRQMGVGGTTGKVHMIKPTRCDMRQTRQRIQ
jgi:hypothetical protein